MEHKMITVNDVLTQLYPELPDDDTNYRLFKMNEGFSLDQLSETDFAYYKRVNDFTDGDKLVVVQDSQIIYVEY
jgi:hypothetical protein